MRHRKLFVALAALGALTLAATAWALWTWSQSTNALQSKTGAAPTMVFHTPTAGDLTGIQGCTPGGSCDLIGEVDNPSTSAVKIVSYQPSLAAGYNATGCNATYWSGPGEVTTLTTLATPITVPASAAGFLIDLPAALSLASNAPTSCMSEAVTVASGTTIALNFTVGT